MISREVQLKQRPSGMPSADDFTIVETEVADPQDNEVQVVNVCMSVDPYMRGRMVDRKSYTPPFQLGETLTGGAIGQVAASRAAGIREGDYVQSNFGWREAFTAPADQISPLGKLAAPASAYLGALGMPGMTAYVGLLEVGALADGETVFVSGAAGAVGSIVGQIARLRDCHVIGSAGSAEKIAWLRDELKFDAVFDYHGADILAQLRKSAPDGIDVYFDNVGGDHLEAALFHMRPFGRIALCGAISQYNATEPVPGPVNLTLAIGLGLTLRGFIVNHFNHLAEKFRSDMEGWINSGQIQHRETVFNGIERAPEAFIGLFTGENIGKMIVALD